MNIRRAAREFTRDLMTAGSNERAHRLVLMVDQPKPRDLGGLCEEAVFEKVFLLLSSVRCQLEKED